VSLIFAKSIVPDLTVSFPLSYMILHEIPPAINQRRKEALKGAWKNIFSQSRRDGCLDPGGTKEPSQKFVERTWKEWQWAHPPRGTYKNMVVIELGGLLELH
jgi:hypothetical protein